MNILNIFYADDDQDDIMFFEEAINDIIASINKSIKFHPHINGENLLESISDKSVDNSLIFLDLNMPIKNGFQLLEEIRKEPAINDIPVIIYSTSSDDGNIELSRKLGANYYAIKPNSFGDLKRMIEKAININWKNHMPDFNNFIFK